MRRMLVAAIVLAAVFTGAAVRWWLADRAIARVAMYRAIGRDGVDDFLTTSLDEKNAAVAGGYKDQPAPFFVSGAPRPDLVPIERLLSPDETRHYYTTYPEEVQALVGQGWRHERFEGYLRPRSGGQAIEVYHLYNPTENRHFFTVSRDELASRLASNQWQQQTSLGFAWRAP